MKYFRIGSENNGNVLPHIKNWMEKIDYHSIQTGDILKLPNRTLLYVENHQETVFADILETPFFLVSDMVWKVMKQYEENIRGKQIVLLDDIYGIVKIYHIPILMGYEARIPFFQEKSNGKNSMIGRLDFVESILRRGAKGLRLQEIQVGGTRYESEKL